MTVAEAPSNTQPQILTSSLPGPAAVGVDYQAQIEAIDADRDKLHYSVDSTSYAKGIRIDENGLLTWARDLVQAGTHTIVVTVDDKRPGGLVDSPALSLTVDSDPAVNNAAPTVHTASIPGPAVQGVTYRTQIDATDPNGDKLTFTLSEATGAALPADLTIDEHGVLTWLSPVAKGDGTDWQLVVTVNDGRGGSDQNDTPYLLSVSTGVKNNPPEIRSVPRGTMCSIPTETR